MFFHHNITIIFITRGKIKSAVFSTNGKIIKEVKLYNWKEETLQGVLRDIASRGPNKVRVVFGEEFSYVATLSSSKIDRASILEKAREVIPDELENNWDFKKEKDADFSSQVIAVQPRLLDLVISNMEEAGLQIEAIEPQSLAFARLIPKAGLFLFVAKDEKTLLGAVYNGVVVGTHVLADKNDISILGRFVSAAQKKCHATAETIFVSKEIKFSNKVLSASGLRPENLNLDPLYAMAIKKHLVGEDSRVLNITSTKETQKKPTIQKQTADDNKTKQVNSRFSLREKVLAGLFVGLVVIGVVLIQMKYRKTSAISIVNMPKKQIVIQNESAAPQIEQPQQSQIEVAVAETVAPKKAQDLQISILNGGAIPGSAAKVQKLLTKAGYLNIEAKNADSLDSVGVVIYYQNPNADNAAKIKEELQVKYPKVAVALGVSDEQKSAEIVIILGK